MKTLRSQQVLVLCEIKSFERNISRVVWSDDTTIFQSHSKNRLLKNNPHIGQTNKFWFRCNNENTGPMDG